MLHRKVKIATKEHLGAPLLVIWLYIQPFLLFSQEITFNLHTSRQNPFAKLWFALENFRVEHRNIRSEYSVRNCGSKTIGTIKVEI